MFNGNKAVQLANAIDDVVDGNGGRINGIEFAPSDNTLNTVIQTNLKITVGNKAMDNAARLLFVTSFINAFTASYDVLRASFYGSGDTGTVNVFTFVINERAV